MFTKYRMKWEETHMICHIHGIHIQRIHIHTHIHTMFI